MNPTINITCRKIYKDLPFAHRQHSHKGHCSLIHGHNWAFAFTFGCHTLDPSGFVIDFGKLKFLRTKLESLFDHTLVLNVDDPHLEYLRETLITKIVPVDWLPVFAKIVTVPNCGAEGLAKYLHRIINELLCDNNLSPLDVARGVCVLQVEVFEDSRNSATYYSEDYITAEEDGE